MSLDQKLRNTARLVVEELTTEYRQAFGQKEYDSTVLMLEKIIDYTDKKLSAKDE